MPKFSKPSKQPLMSLVSLAASQRRVSACECLSCSARKRQGASPTMSTGWHYDALHFPVAFCYEKHACQRSYSCIFTTSFNARTSSCNLKLQHGIRQALIHCPAQRRENWISNRSLGIPAVSKCAVDSFDLKEGRVELVPSYKP